MAVTIGAYNGHTSIGGTWSWTGITVSAGTWILSIHGLSGGTLDDMDADPRLVSGGGPWQLVALADAGPGLPKMSAWARKITVTGTYAANVAGPAGLDNHGHIYLLHGCYDSDDAEQVFSGGAASSATPGTAEVCPLYSPDASGLLIGAWLADAVLNFTSLGGLTPEAEVDGTLSTSCAGEQALSAYGPSSRTATTLAAVPWAAVTIAVREQGGAVTFPTAGLQFRTEIAPGANPGADPATWAGLWTDITDDVNGRDPIAITRGRGDEASTVAPSTLDLTVNNVAGKYVRLNPLSPYYGQLSKNTPIRQWVNPGSGWLLRQTTFVSEWPPRSQGGQVDETMPISGSGITRRLAQGQTLRSAIYRAVTAGGAVPDVVAYWPLESDGSTALERGRALTASGPVSWSSDGPAGSAGSVSFDANGQLAGPVTMGQVPPTYLVHFWLDIPVDYAGPPDAYGVLVNWRAPGGATTYDTWLAGASNSFPDKVGVQALQVGGANQAMFSNTVVRGRGPTLVSVHVVQSVPGTVTVGLYIDGVFDNSMTFSDTVAAPVGVGTNLFLLDGTPIKGSVSHLIFNIYPNTGLQPTFLGGLTTVGRGYAGEVAGDRITRLSAEEGVPVVIVGARGVTEPMGPQPIGQYLDLIRDCESADGGVLFEQRGGRLAYQTREDRYNADPTLTLDYGSGHVAPPLEPTDDDQRTRNDWTVDRQNGGSARVLDQAHIDAVGEYGDSATVNVADDDQLLDQAGWRVHVGTVDDLRYPAVAPNLNGSPGLIPNWTQVDVGKAVRMTNPGRDLPPGTIDLFAEGYTETLDVVSWTATANCSPGAPWRVGVTDDPVLGRADTDGSQLASGVTSTATTFSVATTTGPLWTVSGGDTPMDLMVGGEQVTVRTVGTVLNANPFFDVDALSWSAFNGSIGRSVAQVYPDDSAAASLLITPDGINANGGVNSVSTAVGSITAGQDYTAMLWVYSPGGWADIRPGIDWQDSSGTLLSNAFGPLTAAPAGVWTHLSVTLTAPVGVSRASVRGRHAGTPPSSAIWYAWAIRLVPVASANTSPQPMTVIRSINGVVKAQPAGAPVAVAQPMILST
jgi:hypothetical protein